jgi:hypothetical protein
VAEDADVGTVIYRLVAKDLDVESPEALNFAFTDPITATDKNGKEVKSDVTFKVCVVVLIISWIIDSPYFN